MSARADISDDLCRTERQSMFNHSDGVKHIQPLVKKGRTGFNAEMCLTDSTVASNDDGEKLAFLSIAVDCRGLLRLDDFHTIEA